MSAVDTAAMGTTELSCLICDSELEVTSCTNIFYTSLPRNGELLASFILRVLRSATSELHSSYICSRCYNLFQMLDQAQFTATNIRCEILKVYRTGDKHKFVKDAPNVNAEVLSDGNDKIFMDNLVSENKVDITCSLNDLQDVSTLKTISDEANNLPADNGTIPENTLIEQDLNVLTVDTADITQSKIVNKPEVKPSEIDTLNIYIKTKESRNKSDDTDDTTNKQSVHFSESVDLNKQNITDSLENTILIESNPSVDLSRQEKMALYTRQCRTCSSLFKSVDDLEFHLLKHGGSRPYLCKKCNQRFSDLSQANIHATEFHVEGKDVITIAIEPSDNEVPNFEQDDCILPEDVLRMSDDEEQDDFEWKETNQSVTEMKDSLKHIQGNPNGCSDPNTKILKDMSTESSNLSWKSGRISKYSLKPLKHPCPTCGKKWRTSAELKTHLKSHSTLRPYMCEKCGQAYKHKHALEVHVGMHNGINPFQCSFCNKCFTQKGALMRHLPMHTGETPYQCELCGKRFVHHTSYNMHALSHTGKKSYQCHVCNQSLLSTSHLKRHMRAHTGEKPYSCSLCGKRFAERYNLFAHQKIHDPAEIMAKEAKKMQYKCERCMALFDKKQKLDDHVKQQHEMDPEIGNNGKWMAQAIDIQTRQAELAKFYSPENQSVSKDSSHSNIEQTWQQIDYSKSQNSADEAKSIQPENQFLELDANTVTVALDNHRLLLDSRYNKNIHSNLEISSNTHVQMDRSQI